MSAYPSTSEFSVSRKLKTGFLFVGLLGLTVAALGVYGGLVENHSRPVYSWFLGFSIWFSISIGMLFFLLILHVFDSGWGVIVRRQLEHAVGFFPYLALIFAPLVLIGWFYTKNPGILWEWMNMDLIPVGGHGPVGEDPIYLNKAGLLNLPFFTVRVVIYFGVYWFLTYKLRMHSFKMDLDSNPSHVHANRFYAAAGLPITALITTFAAFDFFMSLSYHWFSTMYGVWFFATSMRAGLAVTVLICTLLASRGYLKGVFGRPHLYLLGCIFLAFTVFWAYITFCQYFLIYNANIPEETFWFNVRELSADGSKSSWWFVGVVSLVFGYFLIPFLILLFYKTKVIVKRMVFISCWILAFFVFDVYFNILPHKIEADNIYGYVVEPFSITMWDISAIIGVGCIFIWSFLRSMSKAQPIPMHDPRIEESLHAHE